MKKVLKTEQKPGIQLSKGIYSGEIDPAKTPFGFLNDQRRNDSVLNNAGWFNGAGDKLGTGDLSIDDLILAGKQLTTGEMFLVLSEFDTSWDMPSHLDKQAPGIDYVMKNIVWAVYSGSVYRVKNSISRSVENAAGFTEIPRSEFHKAVGYGVKNMEATKEEAKPSPLKDDDDLNALIQQAKAVLQKQGKITSAPQAITSISGNVPTHPAPVNTQGQGAMPPIPTLGTKKKVVKKKTAPTTTAPAVATPGPTPASNP